MIDIKDLKILIGRNLDFILRLFQYKNFTRRIHFDTLKYVLPSNSHSAGIDYYIHIYIIDLCKMGSRMS